MNFIKKHTGTLDHNEDFIKKTPFSYFVKLNKLNSKSYPKIISNEKKDNKIKNFSGTNRHFVPAIKEWHNSVYTYKCQTMKLLPSSDKAIFNIVKNYLNFYNVKNKDARSIRARRRMRRYSFKRLIVGKPNIKHTNKNVTVIIYLYNRRPKYLLNQINTMITLDNISIKNYNNFIKNIKEKLSPLYKYKKIFSLKKNSSLNSMLIHKDLTYIMYKYLSVEINSLQLRQLSFIENSKFNKHYLLPLIKLIEIIYKKKIILNFINIKYIYNSASILADSIVNKLKKRKKNPLNILEKAIDMFQLPPTETLSIYDEIYNKRVYTQNMKLQDLPGMNNRIISKYSSTFLQNKDIIEYLIEDKILDDFKSNINRIINLLKSKFSTGIRVKVAGRLTRRNTAEKSISKLRYRGNIKNSDSSLKNISTTLLRGHAISSVQYKQSKSKLRIGSFGVKTWVNSN